MKSKENNILELFFNNPTKEWHFEELLKESKMARSKVNDWLKKFIKDSLIKKVKEKGRMPYYISQYNTPQYKIKKRLYSLQKLQESGLLEHLNSLQKANTVIVFGSFTRSDWYKESDIDIFIYGDPKGLKIAEFEMKLHRDIQLFICKDKKELKKLGSGLAKNIIRGNLIKGNLDFVEVGINV